MPIVTDTAVDYSDKFRQCSHMVSDIVGPAGTTELISFALSIGMRQEWLQKPGTRHEHFDIFGKRRIRAIKAGCREISRAELVAIFRAKQNTSMLDESQEIVDMTDTKCAPGDLIQASINDSKCQLRFFYEVNTDDTLFSKVIAIGRDSRAELDYSRVSQIQESDRFIASGD